MKNKLLKGFWGRVWAGTFLPIWFLFFFGFGLFGIFEISSKDQNIVFGLLFGTAGISFITALATEFSKSKNNQNKEKSEIGSILGLVFKIVFGIFWLGMVITMVLPDTIGKYSVEEILTSTGLKIFVGALGIGFLYATFMARFVDSKEEENSTVSQKMESEKSYNEERKGKSFFESFFGSEKNDRFKR